MEADCFSPAAELRLNKQPAARRDVHMTTMAAKLRAQKVKKEVNQLKIGKFTYICIFWYKYPFDTACQAKYRFRSIFYFLVCLSRAIFKDFIGGQTRVSKKIKKRSINSKLENLPMDALFHYR